MFNKFSSKFVASFVILSFLLGFLLSFMKLNYVFDKIVNTNLTKLNNDRYTSSEYEKNYNSSSDKFLILNGSSPEESKVTNNFEEIIKGMDKSLTSIPIISFNGNTSGYRAIIINSEELSEFHYLPELLEYVKKGGNLIFAQRPLINSNLKEVSKYIGIENFNSNEPFILKSMYVKTNILIQGYGLERTEQTENSSLDVKNTKDCMIHITGENDIPLLWEKNLDKGKVFVSNGQFLGEKSNRGILTGILYRTSNCFIYPIINSKVFFIDDFPAPIPNNISDNIYEEYNMNNQRFFNDIWWPDTVELCSNYNLKPTGYLIYNYEDSISDINEFEGQDYYENIVTQGRNLFKVGGELGVHGFNHQPLRLEEYPNDDLGYKPWQDYDSMVDSQKAIEKFIHNVYPNYEVRSYVPPSNIISKHGINAIKEGFPSINVISSLYVVGDSELAYEQEFSKGEDGIYNFPRYSSGYSNDEFQKWIMFNGLTINGVFSHFNHPDDILDPERNVGLGWEKLNKEFSEFMNEIYTKFKWLQADTISEGVDSLDKYLRTKSSFVYEEGIIRGALKESSKDDYFILRTEKPINRVKGCTYEKIDNEIYLIHSNKTEFEITLK